MDEDVEILRSNKGGLKIIHRGYMYTVHKKRQSGGIRWRCTQRSLQCKGSISTGNGPPRVNMPHNHVPDLHCVAIARCKQFEELVDVSDLLEMESAASNAAMKSKQPVRKNRVNVKTTHYETSFKQEVVLYAERTNNREAEKAFGISESNVRRWRKLKDEIFGPPSKKSKKVRAARNRLRKIGLMVPTFIAPKGGFQLLADAMPLQQRLALEQKQEQDSLPKLIVPQTSESVLKSQPLSPTKLRVVRHQPNATTSQSSNSGEDLERQTSEEVCLRWNSHHSNMQTAFPSLLQREQHVDVTLAAEGRTLKCHKLILSSCSAYFEEILGNITPMQHPVIFLKDIPFWILQSLCDFMYAGEVHIDQSKLEELLHVAELLKIKGLARKTTPPQPEQPSPQQNIPKTEKADSPAPSPSDGKTSRPSMIVTRQKFQENVTANMEPLDPLKLLQPSFQEEESTSEPPVVKYSREMVKLQQAKKAAQKKLRKRKSSEHESTPPLVQFRKGTRSRPQVKIPRYYHDEFEEHTKPAPGHSEMEEPLFPVDAIKTEPIDVVENDLHDEDQFQEEEEALLGFEQPDEVVNPVAMRPAEGFVKIRLGGKDGGVSSLRIMDCRTEEEMPELVEEQERKNAEEDDKVMEVIEGNCVANGDEECAEKVEEDRKGSEDGKGEGIDDLVTTEVPGQEQ